MSDAPADLGAAAQELYGLPPGDFTARRDELSKQARAAGHRELAKEVKGLRRPTASAWLLNLAARSDVPQLRELLDLGQRLRKAQEDLDGTTLKQLSAQRSDAERAVLRAVQRLARDEAQELTSAAASEIEQTLRAAVADPRAAAAVVSGRLTRALSYAGFGEVDLSAATATPVDDDSTPDAAPPVEDELAARRAARAKATPAQDEKAGAQKKVVKRPGTKAAKGSTTTGRQEREQRERERREQQAEQARQRAEEQQERERQQRAERLARLRAAVDEARSAAEAADRRLEEAEAAERAAEELVADLHRRLKEARDAVTAASKESATAEREQSRARRAMGQAERELRKVEPNGDGDGASGGA